MNFRLLYSLAILVISNFTIAQNSTLTLRNKENNKTWVINEGKRVWVYHQDTLQNLIKNRGHLIFVDSNTIAILRKIGGTEKFIKGVNEEYIELKLDEVMMIKSYSRTRQFVAGGIDLLILIGEGVYLSNQDKTTNNYTSDAIKSTMVSIAAIGATLPLWLIRKKYTTDKYYLEVNLK